MKPTVEHLVQRGLTKQRAQETAERQSGQARDVITGALAGYASERDRSAMRRALLTAFTDEAAKEEGALVAACLLAAKSRHLVPPEALRVDPRAQAEAVFAPEEKAA